MPHFVSVRLAIFWVCAIGVSQQPVADSLTFLSKVVVVENAAPAGSSKAIERKLSQMSPTDKMLRLPYRRVCADFSDEVSPVLRAAFFSLLSSVPNLTTATSCHTGNDIQIAVFVDDQLQPEEIRIDAPDSGTATRVVSVSSGPGKGGRTGVGMAIFRTLELLGFSFLHPLRPEIPSGLSLPMATVSISETPALAIRGIHLHTMHPTEFADFLNGWGPGGPDDAAGFNQMFSEWKSFLEWMLANGLNRVQWVLLWNETWKDFADSATRQERLSRIVNEAHLYGIEVGIDAPIALAQQNAFRLLRNATTPTAEETEMQGHIDYLMATGIDFLALESGTSEFSHDNARRMLQQMNFVTRYVADTYGKSATIKVHVSSDQQTSQYLDPVTEEPLNINFLPHYADPRLGVMAHTVAYYGLTTPAPVYGNTDFSSIRQFMRQETRHREVIWYPESAYWCSFDIDVPLFLPIYALQRFTDLRHILQETPKGEAGDGIDGQVIFSSGWEWGYWLGDVAAARGAWNPLLSIEDEDTAFVAFLENLLSGFGTAAFPLAELIAKTAWLQLDLLLMGAGVQADQTFDAALSGQAYLQGVDPLDEMAEQLAKVPLTAIHPTQPGRMSLMIGADSRPLTAARVRTLATLLAQMESTFFALQKQFAALSPMVESTMLPLYREFEDAIEITALRAAQVHALFLFQLAKARENKSKMHQLEARSIAHMATAKMLVYLRETEYRISVDRIATWRNSPTAYGFGYLWPVHSLYYWKRDHLKITQHNDSPCVANIFDPYLLAFGKSADSTPIHILFEAAGIFKGITKWQPCFQLPRDPDNILK